MFVKMLEIGPSGIVNLAVVLELVSAADEQWNMRR